MAEMASDGRPAEAARTFMAVVATDHELAVTVAAGYEDTWARYVPVALQEFQQTHLISSDAPRPTDPSLLAQISAPVLVLHGSQTPLRSLTDGVDHVARYVPDARVLEMPSVGHLALIVQPTLIAEDPCASSTPLRNQPEPPASPIRQLVGDEGKGVLKASGTGQEASASESLIPCRNRDQVTSKPGLIGTSG
jgi:hypothetical protein